MRVPVAVNLKSRDGTTTKDAKIVNAFVEPDGDVIRMRSRPGNSDLGLVRAGTAQGVYYYNGQIITVHGNSADRSTLSPLSSNAIGTLDGVRPVTSIIRPPTSIAVTVSAAGTTTVTAVSGATHNMNVGDPFTIVGSTTGAFNGSYVVASVVNTTSWRYTIGSSPTASSGATASVPQALLAEATTPANHGFRVSQSIVIAGASPGGYNGTITVTSIPTPTSFQYALASNLTTPATGTITATPSTVSLAWHMIDNGLTSGTSGYLLMQGEASAGRLRSDWDFSGSIGATYPSGTVPGGVFLDGYFFVMDTTGNIWNNNLDSDPGTGANWAVTSFTKANKFSGAGVCLARSTNYVIALKEFSTEPFYDAGNSAPGSPLSPVANGYTQIGCASAASVAQVEDSLLWVSQTRSKGRGVYMMAGSQQQKISTVDVEKILDGDDLATVYAYGMKLQGHVLYVLTLATSNITLVYDLTTQSWCQWSSLTPQTPASITSLVRSGTTVTATFAAAHNLNDGDPLLIAGASPSTYNGIWQVSSSSSTVVTFQITGSPTTPATGTITGARYVESYFKFSHYVNAGGRDVLLHESDGHLYQISSSLHQDAGNPIRVFSRSERLDGSDTKLKVMPRLFVIADAVGDYVMVRHSEDDSQTFSSYRLVDLSVDRPQLRRLGPFRRRTLETCFVGNNPLRIESLELEASE